MSDEIQRYDLHGPDWGLNVCEVEPDNDGEFILYSDHLAIIEDFKRQMQELRGDVLWLLGFVPQWMKDTQFTRDIIIAAARDRVQEIHARLKELESG